MLCQIAKPLVRLADRYIPSAFFFAVALTVLVALLSIFVMGTSPNDLVLAWGDSLSGLLAFMTQIALVLLLGFTLAHTAPMQWLLERAANLPKRPAAAYGFVTLVTGVLSLINWGLGLIAGGIMAVQVAKAFRDRGGKLHYPLLVAAAYSGWVVFHMGYSGSAPLAAATAGSIYSDLPGGLVDVSRTIFSTWNMIAIVVTLGAVTIAMMRLAPSGDDVIIEAPDAVFEEQELVPKVTRSERRAASRLGTARRSAAQLEEAAAHPSTDSKRTPANFIDAWRVPTLTIGVALGLYVVAHFSTRGFELTLDIVNWTFLSLVLLFVGNIRELTDLVSKGGRTVADILIQYPFYAGIIGMMTVSGLAKSLSDMFVSIASPDTLGLFAFLSAGLLNMFIPSGGGQFAVQAPIFADAAASLGVDQSVVVMAIAYGDQWTNMIQPFWAIPLLAVAGLRVRDIMGYTIVTLVVSGVVFAATLLIVGSGS